MFFYILLYKKNNSIDIITVSIQIMYQQHQYKSPFRSRAEVVLTDVVEQMVDGQIEEVAVPRPKKNKIKYLPGEKLLLKLNKQHKKDKGKKKTPFDMSKIDHALNNIIEGF